MSELHFSRADLRRSTTPTTLLVRPCSNGIVPIYCWIFPVLLLALFIANVLLNKSPLEFFVASHQPEGVEVPSILLVETGPEVATFPSRFPVVVETPSPIPTDATFPSRFPVVVETSSPIPTDTTFPFGRPVPDINYKGCMENCQKRNTRPAIVAPEEPCTEADHWCSINYTPDKILDVCNVMCKNQYPPDCASAKYLVFPREWENGYGSDTHVREVGFVMAMTEERVFIYSPDIKSVWTFDNDPYKPCAKRNAWCYYLPITSCQLPANWSTTHVEYHESMSHANAQFVTRTLYQTVEIGTVSEQSTPQRGTKFGHLPFRWWKNHMAQFLYRPNEYFMQNVILPKVLVTFGKHAEYKTSLFPSKFLAVFIRQGDKGTESKTSSPQDYWNVIKSKCEQLNLTNVYIASDSKSALAQTIALASNVRPVISFYSIPYDRPEKGITGYYLRENLYSKPGIRPLIGLTLTDFFIASQVAFF